MTDKAAETPANTHFDRSSRILESFENPIRVTRPFLPAIEEFTAGLQAIWDNPRLTNDGPVLQRFMRQLSSYFETDDMTTPLTNEKPTPPWSMRLIHMVMGKPVVG